MFTGSDMTEIGPLVYVYIYCYENPILTAILAAIFNFRKMLNSELHSPVGFRFWSPRIKREKNYT